MRCSVECELEQNLLEFINFVPPCLAFLLRSVAHDEFCHVSPDDV